MELGLTSKVCDGLDVESNGGGRTGVGGTDGWNDQPGSSPSWGHVTISSSESCESASVGPGEVFSAQWRAIVAGELFGETAIGWGVLSVDENEAISEIFDGGDQGGIG